MTHETPKYYLYASRNLTVPDGVEWSLVPMCSGGRYILLYTDKVLENGYKRLDESVELEQEELSWLVKVKLTLNTRFLHQHENEYAEVLNGFAEALEKELAEESKKVGEKK